MQVNLNTAKAVDLAALTAATAEFAPVEAEDVNSSILSPQSLKVLYKGGDLEKLAAILLNDSEEARYDSVMGVLANALEVVNNINAAAAKSDSQTLNAISAETSVKKTAEELLEDAEERLSEAEDALDDALDELEDAEDELEDFYESYDPADSASVARKAELEAAVQAANAAVTAAKNEVASLEGSVTTYQQDVKNAIERLDNLCDRLSDESHLALIDAIKLALGDVEHLLEPLVEEDPPSAAPKGMSDMTISELVQYVTDRRNEMIDDIDSRRRNEV